MKISVKTLKGDLFHIEAEETDTVTALKEKIQSTNATEFAVDRQKLIHGGKVLKDQQTVAELGLKEQDFLVCMVTKEVKAKPAPAPAAAPVAAPSSVAAPPTPVAAPIPAAPLAPPTPAGPSQFETPEAVQALVGMGFPEAESRAALTAAMGNPDLAYEFLLTGIPENLARRAAPAATPPQAAVATTAPPASTGNSDLDGLRQHPQFNQLKQLIQSDPTQLPRVLALLGSQSPQLLAAITANDEAFLAMMNEPITEQAPQQAFPPQQLPQMPMAGGQPNPAQVMQMLASLPPQQRNQFAQQLGLSPEQLNGVMQMVSQMPPDQLQQMMGGMGGAGGVPPGAHVIRLTEEEHASVSRLTGLGFSQQQAVEAYIACDRNEQLAANYLFENGDDGFEGGGMGGFEHHDHDHDDDDMYN